MNLNQRDFGSGAPINVIMLPKVLSEVDAEIISDLIAKLSQGYLDEKLALVISFRGSTRKDEKYKDYQKGNKIIKEIKEKTSFIKVKRFYIHANNEEYKEKRIYHIPDLPDMGEFVNRTIINLANDPGQFCCGKDNCPDREEYYNSYGSRECACMNRIGRYPVMWTKYFDSHIFLYERSECPF